jgi:spermidine synthase
VSEPVVVDRVDTARGELVLRRDGEHFEVISNGTFLMDTRNGESERVLVDSALVRNPQAREVLIGGLGVGFSVEAATRHADLRRITVVEIEPAIIRWNRTHFAHRLVDPRIALVNADLIKLLTTDERRYDAICLDIDNGPDWTVSDANRSLYDEDGTALLGRRLQHGGVLAVWSAARSASYEQLLRRHFGAVEVVEVPVPRGEPDVVMIVRTAG